MSSERVLPSDIAFEATDITRAPTAASMATRNRHKKKRQRKHKGGKRGNPGVFQGARLEFLTAQYPDYHATRGKGRKVSNKYWLALFALYWTQFPWYLPIDKEPNSLDEFQEPEENDDTLAAKKVIIEKTQQVCEGIRLFERGIDML
ncbi:hypothetical protein C8Q73DRAFT_663108 [Cubamyces lactineus]|nr:hypothetical protein C8Q73DRAFT_663108 [Cubamyces lactineus]